MNFSGDEILIGKKKVNGEVMEGKMATRALEMKKVELVKAKSNSFCLDDILGGENWDKGRKRMKVVFKNVTPAHRRQPSVFYTNLTEIYTFEEDLEFDERELDGGRKNELVLSNGRRSTLASTAKKMIESGRVSSISEEIENQVKGDENLDTLPCNTFEEIDLGSLPTSMYCFECKSQVLIETRPIPVKFQFWSFICCMSSTLPSSKSFETCICARCGSNLGQKLITN
jgi:hypothetical protein